MEVTVKYKEVESFTIQEQLKRETEAQEVKQIWVTD